MPCTGVPKLTAQPLHGSLNALSRAAVDNDKGWCVLSLGRRTAGVCAAPYEPDGMAIQDAATVRPIRHNAPEAI